MILGKGRKVKNSIDSAGAIFIIYIFKQVKVSLANLLRRLLFVTETAKY